MKFAKNIIANWSSIFLSIISVFITYPLLAKSLGEEQYGIWLYIASVTNYLALFQMGVPLANVRYIAKFNATNEPDKVNEVLSTNFVFYSCIAILVAVIGIIFSLIIEHAFSISSEYVRVAKMAVLLAALNLSLSFVLEIFQGVLHALQEFVYLNVVKNIFIVIRLALIVTLIKHVNGIIILACIIMSITLMQGAVMYFMSRHLYKPMHLSLAYVNKSIFKEISKYSIFVMLLQVAGMISFESDAIVIGSFISVSSILSFTLASSVLIYFMQFVTGISQLILPKASACDATNDNAAIVRLYYDYSKLTAAIVLPICAALIISGGDFIALWMGEKYRIVSGNILSILSISFLFFLVQRGVAFPIFMGASKMKILSLIMLVTGVANILLSIWWGMQFGVYGVAWGTTVPNLFTVMGVLWFMKKTYHVGLINYFRETMLFPVISALIFSGVLLVMKGYIPQSSYIAMALTMLACFSVYALLVKYVCYPKGIRATVQA